MVMMTKLDLPSENHTWSVLLIPLSNRVTKLSWELNAIARCSAVGRSSSSIVQRKKGVTLLLAVHRSFHCLHKNSSSSFVVVMECNNLYRKVDIVRTFDGSKWWLVWSSCEVGVYLWNNLSARPVSAVDVSSLNRKLVWSNSRLAPHMPSR